MLDKLIVLAESDAMASFVTLARAAGLDPARDFVGASLRDMDFRGEDLRGCNFSRADLTGSDFRRANLTGVRFDDAVLTGAIGLSIPPASSESQASRRFGSLVAEADKTEIVLPLLHFTSTYEFREIVDTEVLAPARSADYPGEELLYLFYGRPSYRMKEERTSLTWKMPVCLVIRPEALGIPKRIFPFDSGAFKRGLARDVLHPAMAIDDFALSPSIETAGKFVNLFYGSNRNYFEGRIRDTKIGAQGDFEADAYQQIRNSRNPDDRMLAIEVQLAHAVRIPDAVMAVIVPSELLEAPSVAEKLKKWDIDILTYDGAPDLSHDSQAINHILGDYFAKKGFFRAASFGGWFSFIILNGISRRRFASYPRSRLMGFSEAP
ncbi:pentapeptide repeat-containing protein [Bradyrhizobium sp. AT1]|uniref:pentapeptide repeat-containing protein n=1 Tax=Bradyrhizobium sp. AT1 TaxID=574934 RepID=UPI0018DDF72F|nr:pentapeptide repeat-containing protein [Bradyrhizobium sp. AT1]